MPAKKGNRKENKPIASEPIKTEPEYIRKWGNQFSQKYTEQEIEKLADEMLEWFETKGENGKPVWLKDFAIEKRMSSQRFSEFEKRNEYFAFVFKICKELQESRLVKIGFQSKNGFPIFTLKNCFNWKDKQDIEHSITLKDYDLKKLTDEQLSIVEGIVSRGEDPRQYLISLGLYVGSNASDRI